RDDGHSPQLHSFPTRRSSDLVAFYRQAHSQRQSTVLAQMKKTTNNDLGLWDRLLAMAYHHGRANIVRCSKNSFDNMKGTFLLFQVQQIGKKHVYVCFLCV